MKPHDQFTASPAAGGFIMTPLEERDDYIQRFISLPPSVFQMLNSGNTAAFIRGLVGETNTPEEYTAAIAFLVLQIAVGKLELAKLGNTLSAELQLPNDKAQAIAKEIEKELFTPVMLELNQYLENRKQKSENSGGKAQQAGARNVVNLKQPPPKPSRPAANNLPKPGQFNK